MNDFLDFPVSIHCITYNHSSFIQETMNGFCIQQTSFPFLTIISDDASTDGEQRLISRYLDEFFAPVQGFGNPIWETDDAVFRFVRHITNTNCYFLVIFLKTNHYSINKSKAYLYNNWEKSVKYIALCEGDDYWIDPLRLQRHVSFLETHPDYSMTCNRVKLFSVRKNKMIGEDYCYENDSTIKLKDVIYRTGLFISTCSIVYRKSITDNYPDYCRKCAVGDYPLQIMAAMKGSIYYFNTAMCVYRMDNPQSWMGRQNWNVADERRISIIRSRINMLIGFSIDYPQYKKYFKNKISDEIRRNLPSRSTNNREYLSFISEFDYEISHMSLPWRIDFLLRTTELPVINRYRIKSKSLFSRFYIKRQLYT